MATYWFLGIITLLILWQLHAVGQAVLSATRQLEQIREQLGYGYGGSGSFLEDSKDILFDMRSTLYEIQTELQVRQRQRTPSPDGFDELLDSEFDDL